MCDKCDFLLSNPLPELAITEVEETRLATASAIEQEIMDLDLQINDYKSKIKVKDGHCDQLNREIKEMTDKYYAQKKEVQEDLENLLLKEKLKEKEKQCVR